MNKLYEFDYNGTHYEIKVNNRVRLALDRLQKEKITKGLSKECIDAISKIDLSSLDEGNTDISKLAPMLPYMSEFQNIEVEPFEVFQTILRTLYHITDEQFEEICDMLDEKLGAMELCKVVGKISKDAFTLVEKMNKALESK